MDYAEREFALMAAGEDGHSYRAHLQGQLSRARDPQRIAELEGELALPPFPEPLRYLWRAFARMRNRTNGSGLAVPRISLQDLDAFNRLSGLGLRPWEIEIIEALDDLFLASIIEPKRDSQ